MIITQQELLYNKGISAAIKEIAAMIDTSS
jgi:hypothetical protein